jgi:hypothetical protein
MPELGIGLGITKGAVPKTKLLLDKYDIDAAFSLRKVRADYNGPCVRVRNSSGDFADIGFTSSGALDEAALNAHCGDNDGAVQTWYNQSTEGGRYNAVQDTQAHQPIIYDASAGGYLGYIDTDATGSTNDTFVLENETPACPSILAVYQQTADSGTHNYIVSGPSQGITLRDTYNETGVTWFEGDTQPYLAAYNDGVDYTKKYLLAGYAGGSTNFLTINGYVTASDTDSSVDGISVNTIAGRGGGDRFQGKLWEIFLSTSDLSAKRIALENGILSANGLTVPEQTLLEKYNAGAVAYSLRCVNREYVGPVVEVLGAQTTAVTEDVYLDSTGVVNKSRITELCTDDQDSNALVYGYINKWYDQGGGGVTATNATGNNTKPVIHDSTDGVVLSNGEPAILFNDGDVVLTTGTIPNNSGTTFVVYSPKEYANSQATHMFARASDGTDWFLTAQDGNNTDLVLNPSMTAGITTIRISGVETITTPSSGRNTLYDKTLGKQSLVFVDGWGNGDQAWAISNYSTSGSYEIEGYVQEWIWWDDSIKDAIDDIEKNVNEHYLIYQEATASPATGFLADYSGAAAAYSVRQLGDANICMRVRRDGDDAEKNIGFGSDGFVDTTAISDFCGSDNGFVVTWFDQSGNAVDATQSTAADQPKIYDGTDGIVKENGYPATEWSGGADALETTYTTNSSEFTVAAVAKSDANATNKTIVLVPEALIFYQAIEDARHIQGNSVQTTYTDADFTDQAIHFVGNSGSESFAGENGDTFVTLAESTATNGELKIGNNANGSIGFDGKMQEIVYYTSDQSSNRTAIEENINDAFNIYPDADTTPESGFLNEFSGAAAAYSVRKLGDSPVAMRVRKTVSSVDYYQVIGFDANGDLDTAAIEEFADGNAVFVQTWYDQSGNGRHQVQDTAANQPRIFSSSSSSVESTNDRPALLFLSGSRHFTDSSSNDIDILGHSAHAVFNSGASTPREVVYGDTNPTPYTVFSSTIWNGDPGTDIVVSIDSGGANFDLDGPFTNQRTLSVLIPAEEGGFVSAQRDNDSVATDTNGVSITGDTSFTLGISNSTYNPFTGHYQELIIYQDGKSGEDRTNIQKNQNNYFLVHQEASASPATGLLSEAPNAAAAYSVRQLGDAKLCMKVRRGSDDATKNIGFKNGVVDTAAIEAFCGNSDGTVDTWYDQSGSGNHATQGTVLAQPKIYDNATGIEKDNNGNITTRFLTDGYTLDSEIFLKSDDPDRFLISFVADIDDSDNRGEYFAGVTAQSLNFFENDGANSIYKLRHTNEADSANVNSTFTEPDPAPTSDKIASFLLYAESDEKKLKLNGTQLASSGGVSWTDSSGYKINIGKIGRGYSSDLNNSMYSEFVVWENYADGDVETVGENVNKHYKTQTAFNTGLLDSYPGAAAAYSLRRLSSTYTGPAIEVTSDGSTQDIGFDIEGNLDTSALAAFCGANDGTVSKWYDQSGNSNDAAQATVANQPKIYDGTDGVVLENGKPAVDFDGTNDGLNCSTNFRAATGASTVLSVYNIPERNAIQNPLAFYKVQRHVMDFESSTNYNNIAISTNETASEYIKFTGANLSKQILNFATWDGSSQLSSTDSVELSQDGVIQSQTVGSANFQTTPSGTNSIGYRHDTDSQFCLGTIQEVIVYPSDQSTNRTGIEKNINNHYSIYDQPLLDVVPDAAAAYSLRKLRAGYTGPAINVYNGTDYKDIYFRSDGELDTGAISRFCGSNDGTVAIWYDQSGNANHAEQTTPANRPKIYDGTNGLVTDANGTPSILFQVSSETRFASVSLPSPLTQPISISATVDRTDTGDRQAIVGDSAGPDFRFGVFVESTDVQWAQAGVNFDYGATTTGLQTHFVTYNGASSVGGINGQSVTGDAGSNGMQNFTIGILGTSSTYAFRGKISELIIYESDQDSNRTAAEANINYYYGIY